MKKKSVGLVIAASIAFSGSAASAKQRGQLRERVRTEREVSRLRMCFCPQLELKEVLELTQLTVEGTIARADAALQEDDRPGWEYVYTDYVIDVARVFRLPPDAASRTTPGPPEASPFISDSPSPRAGASARRIRLRVPHQGRVVIDGGTLTDSNAGYPRLAVGQRVITSATYDADTRAWVPVGVLEVRDDRVLSLDRRLYKGDYESVDAFASALAKALPAVVR